MIIIYTLPPNPAKRFETESETVILGRKPRKNQHVDIDLRPDGYVSHVHARFCLEKDGCWIEDLNSENGTWIDGKKYRGKNKIRTW